MHVTQRTTTDLVDIVAHILDILVLNRRRIAVARAEREGREENSYDQRMRHASTTIAVQCSHAHKRSLT